MFIRPINLVFILSIAVLAGGVIYLHSELGLLRESYSKLVEKYEEMAKNQKNTNSNDDSFTIDFEKYAIPDDYSVQLKKLNRLEDEYRKSIENLKSIKSAAEDPSNKIVNLENRVKSLESGVIKVEGLTREQLKEELKKINEEERKAERERWMRRVADRIIDDLKERLNLNDAQTEKISQIIEERMQKMLQIFRSQKPREEVAKEIQTLVTETDQQIYGILTAEQRTAYDEYKAENPWLSGRMGRYYGGSGGGRRGGGSRQGGQN